MDLRIDDSRPSEVSAGAAPMPAVDDSRPASPMTGPTSTPVVDDSRPSEVAAGPAAASDQSSGFLGDVKRRLEQSWHQGRADAAVLNQTIPVPFGAPPDAAKTGQFVGDQLRQSAELEKQITPGGKTAVANIQDALKNDPDAADPKADAITKMSAFLRASIANPGGAVQVAAQSGASSIPSMIGGFAGTPLGPAGIAAGAGLGSFVTDYASTIHQGLVDAGVDPTDPASLDRAINDPKVWGPIRDSAIKHGIPVALFDGLSAGLAGKVGGVVNRAVEKNLAGLGFQTLDAAGKALPSRGASLAAKAAGGASEVAAQAGYGAAGEAGGQELQSGQITDPYSVFAEALGEIVPGMTLEPGMHAVSHLMQPGGHAAATDTAPPNRETPDQPVTPRAPDDFSDLYNQARGVTPGGGITAVPIPPNVPSATSAPGGTPAGGVSPNPILDSPQAALARGAGHADDEIADMTPQQLQAVAQQAQQAGVQPAPRPTGATAGAAPAPMNTQTAPSPGFATIGQAQPVMTPQSVNAQASGVFTPGNANVEAPRIQPPEVATTVTPQSVNAQTAGVFSPSNANEQPSAQVGDQTLTPSNLNVPPEVRPVPPGRASTLGLQAVEQAAQQAGPTPRVPFQKTGDTLAAREPIVPWSQYLSQREWERPQHPIEQHAQASIEEALRQHGLPDQDIGQLQPILRRAAYLHARGVELNAAIVQANDEFHGIHEEPNVEAPQAGAQPLPAGQSQPVEGGVAPGAQPPVKGRRKAGQAGRPNEPGAAAQPAAHPSSAQPVEEPAPGHPGTAAGQEPGTAEPAGGKRPKPAVKPAAKPAAEPRPQPDDRPAADVDERGYRTPTTRWFGSAGEPVTGGIGGPAYGSHDLPKGIPEGVRFHDGTGFYSAAPNGAKAPAAPKWLARAQTLADEIAKALDLPPIKLWTWERSTGLANSAGVNLGAKSSRTDNVIHIALRSDLDASRAISSMFHEIGHSVSYAKLRAAPAATQQSIIDAYKAWRKKVGKTTLVSAVRPWLETDSPDTTMGDLNPAVANYLLDFEEFIADQVRDWLATKREPQSLADKFFKGLADFFRAFYEKAVGYKGTIPEIDRFMRGLWDGKPTEPGKRAGFGKLDEPRQEIDQISSRYPTNKRAGENPLTEKLTVGLSAMKGGKAGPKAFAHNMALLKSYPGFVTTATDPEEIADAFMRHVEANLLWLHDQVPEATRERSKRWYDGANHIARQWAAQFGLPLHNVAGVLAALSPKTDWFRNVSAAERVLDIHAHFIDPANAMQPNRAMKDVGERIFGGAQDRGANQLFLKAPYHEMPNDLLKAMWLRTYDEAMHPQDYREVTPEGEFYGHPVGGFAWNGLDAIAKAIRSIGADLDAVSTNMGAKNKIRSFFNNIIAPNADTGDVTIDTHAVAAALLRALSQLSPEVLQNFGSSVSAEEFAAGVQNAKNNDDTGAAGLYGIYAEAYNRAAERVGLLPRQLQSITWEAVRGLFPAAQKRGAGAAQIDAIWQRVSNGELTPDEARAEILKRTGGVNAPAWVQRSGDPGTAAARPTSYAGKLAGARLSRWGATGGRRAAGAGRLQPSPGFATLGGHAEDLPGFEPVSGRGAAGGGAGQARFERSLRSFSESAPRLDGLPSTSPGPNARIADAAARYLEEQGLPSRRQASYVKADPARGKRLADAYEAMRHDPEDPQVAAAYAALAKETEAQYRAAMATGLKLSVIKEGMPDPYPEGPKQVLEDLKRGRLWLYPTTMGFGSLADIRDNPLLAPTPYVVDGHPLVVNDLFRVVHDFFGHGREGVGFGASGEENTWQSHVRMFSPLAARAMTSETRGQNSWVNYGPHGEANRANQRETVYADQKTGLLPEWASTEGMDDLDARHEIEVFHGTPHVYPKEVEIEHLATGKREFIPVGDGEALPDHIAEGLRNNTIAVREHPLGRFRLDKIGTGEGAQVYGWGLYFAERKSIAKTYRDTLSKRGERFLQVGEQRIYEPEDFIDAVADANDTDAMEIPQRLHDYLHAIYIDMYVGEVSLNKGMQRAKATLAASGKPVSEKMALRAATMIQKAKVAREFTSSKGALYTASINRPTEHFLHHDLDAQDQPQYVKDALGLDNVLWRPAIDGFAFLTREEAQAKADQWTAAERGQSVYRVQEMHPPGLPSYFTIMQGTRDWRSGSDIYSELSRTLGSDEAASRHLRDQGIAGIRYADNPSRQNVMTQGERAEIETQIAHWQKMIAEFEGYPEAGDGFVREPNGNLHTTETVRKTVAAGEREIARLQAKLDASEDVTHNYVLFDDQDVEIQAREDRSRLTTNEMDRKSRQNANSAAQAGVLPTFQRPSDPTVTEIVKAGYLNPRSGHMAEGVQGMVRSLTRIFQDNMIDVKATEDAIKAAGGNIGLMNRVYQIASLFQGKAGHEQEQLIESKLTPIVKAMADQNLSVEDMNQLLYAQHAPERNARMQAINPNVTTGSGMSDAEAAAIVGRATPQMLAMADRIRGITKDTVQYQWDHGLLSPAAAVQFGLISRNDPAVTAQYTPAEIAAIPQPYQFYVPLRGWEGEIADGSLGTGTGYQIGGAEYKQAYGRDSKADGPMAYVFADASRAITRGQKNEVGLALLRLVNSNPNPEMWAVDRPERQVSVINGIVHESYRRNNLAGSQDNVVPVKVGGKERHVHIFHKGMADAMTGLGNQQIHPFLGWLAKLNRWISTVNTSLAPEWFAANVIRDLQTALTQLGDDADTKGEKGLRTALLKNWPMAVAGALGKGSPHWNQAYERFVAAGGKIAWVETKGVEDFKKWMTTAYRDAKGPQNPMHAARLLTSAILGRIEHWSGAMENATRLAAFQTLIDRGYSEQVAASVARELTVNFNRRGTMGPVLNSFYVFFNATVQGNVRLAQALGRSRSAQVMAGTMLLAGLAEAMINGNTPGDDGDDDWYENIPQYQRERSLIIHGRYFGWQGQDPYIRIPLPYGLNVFKALGMELGRAFNRKISPMHAAADVMSSVVNAFNPLGSAGLNSWGGIASTLAPTALDLPLDLGSNRNWAFDQPIHPANDFDKRPAAYQAYRSTSVAARNIAEWINSLTGGDKFQEGALSVYPGSVDYMLSFFGGGLARTLEKGYSSIAHLTGFDDTPLPTEQIPFASSFSGHASDDRAESRGYWDIKKASEDAQWQLKQRNMHGDTAGLNWLNENRKLDLNIGGSVKAAERQLAELSKQERQITDSDTLDSDTKRDVLATILAKRLKVQSQVVRRYKALSQNGAAP